MKAFRIILEHDKGLLQLAVFSSSFESAVNSILLAENAPECAIRDVFGNDTHWMSIDKFKDLANKEPGQNPIDNYIKYSIYGYACFTTINRKTKIKETVFYVDDKQVNALDFIRKMN